MSEDFFFFRPMGLLDLVVSIFYFYFLGIERFHLIYIYIVFCTIYFVLKINLICNKIQHGLKSQFEKLDGNQFWHICKIAWEDKSLLFMKIPNGQCQ